MILLLTALGIAAALMFVGEEAVLPGAVFGFLLAKVLQLSEKLELLNKRLSQAEQKLTSLQTAPQPDAAIITASADSTAANSLSEEPPTIAAAEFAETGSPPQYIDVTSLLFPPEPVAAANQHVSLQVPASTAEFSPSLSAPSLATPTAGITPDQSAISDLSQSRIWTWAMNYLREGNPVVKIGMVVLFFGLAFLIRHLADQGWFPIEARLSAIGVTGFGLIGIGWRTRNRNFHYGLILQGGGLAVCYLTLFAAMKFAPILSSGQTFAGMLLITCAGVALAVRQQAQVLALFATAGGFMVPVLTSDGSNNFVGLFSFYLLLNLGILTIAWFQSWRLLNWTGFVFTFGISLGWAVLQYSPADYAVVQAFMLGYFLLYLAVSLLFSLRQPPKLTGLVDGSLVFGLPLAAFAIQAVLMDPYEYGLAWSSALLALIYASMAGLVWRKLWQKNGATHQLYLESQIALALLFATLVIPLALSGHWISVSWALEAAGLLWLGLRQQRLLSRLAAYLLYLLALAGFFAFDLPDAGAVPLLSGDFIDLMLLALPALIMATLLEKYGHGHEQQAALFPWGIGWLLWLTAFWLEVSTHLDPASHSGTFTLLLALSCLLSYQLSKGWPVLATAMHSLLPFTALIHLRTASPQPLTLAEIAGVLSFALMQYFWLYQQRQLMNSSLRRFYHLATGWLLVTLALWQMFSWRELWHLTDLTFSYGLFVMLMLPVLCWLWLSRQPHWPGSFESRDYQTVLPKPLLALLLVWGGWVAMFPAQLNAWYLPLLNAPDLLMLAVVCLFGLYLWLPQQKLTNSALQLLALLSFGWLNVVLLRSLHWLLDIPYQLAFLWQNPQVQMTLSISWTLLALMSMQQASRRQFRGLWLGGGLLLLAVVAKLFTVDLADQGSMARILSFVVVGVLMLLIGYIAPVPAKKPSTDAGSETGATT
ncbi:DUF2339 domain-containing protein [Rheinheimera sp. SA_1]|uniref:DUF2339 domain-containing protein n=1 Tax=Rheinheimera sp. SA_1 TaxID=1827365 RepID=UPI000A485379|nr:DUF2339 domain-containing protein [Rheinheimera sp. SA_1]